MKCGEIIALLEKQWPCSLACEWDNSGLLVGRKSKEVKKIYIALDATEQVVEQVCEGRYDMLITHHPLIFRAIKRINDNDSMGRKLISLIQSDIVCYAMHTNFDIGQEGMAELAGRRLSLENGFPLEVTAETEKGSLGIGRTGRLPQPMTIRRLAGQVKKDFNLPCVTVYAQNMDQMISRVAISPGSGRGMIGAALAADVPVLITGDIGHHEGMDAVEEGLAIIDAGHYGLEHIFVKGISNYLKNRLPEQVRIEEEPRRFPAVI